MQFIVDMISKTIIHFQQSQVYNLFSLDNVTEAGICVWDTQCSEIENTQSNQRCVNGRCVCKEGYAMINHTCHEGK